MLDATPPAAGVVVPFASALAPPLACVGSPDTVVVRGGVVEEASIVLVPGVLPAGFVSGRVGAVFLVSLVAVLVVMGRCGVVLAFVVVFLAVILAAVVFIAVVFAAVVFAAVVAGGAVAFVVCTVLVGVGRPAHNASTRVKQLARLVHQIKQTSAA